LADFAWKYTHKINKPICSLKASDSKISCHSKDKTNWQSAACKYEHTPADVPVQPPGDGRNVPESAETIGQA